MLAAGRAVTLRAVRPEDAALLVEGFERLSAESRLRRFHSPLPGLAPGQVEFLTRVDHHDHEAIVATIGGLGAETGVGVARYVRSRTDPDEADVAVTVSDEWQGRGLGAALLRRLGERAVDEGVTRFTADVLAVNSAMLRLLRVLGPTTAERAGPEVCVTVELTPGQPGPAAPSSSGSDGGGSVGRTGHRRRHRGRVEERPAAGEGPTWTRSARPTPW